MVRRVSRRRESELRIIVKKMRGQVRYFSGRQQIFLRVLSKLFLQRQSNKITPVSLAPRTLEEAPLRRMDRRALNALRKRRADKHMIAFLILLGVLGIAAGVAAIVVWVQYRWVVHMIGLFIDLIFRFKISKGAKAKYKGSNSKIFRYP